MRRRDRIKAAVRLMTGQTPQPVTAGGSPPAVPPAIHPATMASSTSATPQALTRPQLGSIVVHLAATFPVWIRRRKTAFEFVDENVVLTRQSVDFRLRPEHFPSGAVPVDGQRIYVPINIAPKDPLTSFSVVDDDNRALSLLNTSEHGELATDGLSAFMDGQTVDDPAIAPGQFRKALSDIVFAPDQSAGESAYAAAVAEMGTALKDDAIIQPLLSELAGGFAMLVPITYRADEHRVLKIQFVAPFEFTQRGFGGSVRALAASLGFAPKTLQFSNRPIGWAEGTHFEFAQPEEIRLISGRLAVDQYKPGDGMFRQEKRRVVYGKPRMNLNVSVLDPKAPNTGREDTADVILQMRPQAGGTFLNITLIAALSALLLAFFSPRLAQLDGQTTAAILLVVPAPVRVPGSARRARHRYSAAGGRSRPRPDCSACGTRRRCSGRLRRHPRESGGGTRSPRLPSPDRDCRASHPPTRSAPRPRLHSRQESSSRSDGEGRGRAVPRCAREDRRYRGDRVASRGRPQRRGSEIHPTPQG